MRLNKSDRDTLAKGGPDALIEKLVRERARLARGVLTLKTTVDHLEEYKASRRRDDDRRFEEHLEREAAAGEAKTLDEASAVLDEILGLFEGRPAAEAAPPAPDSNAMRQ